MGGRHLRPHNPAAMITPNLFAYFVLAVWPIVIWQFYRRMEPGRALVWTILASYLFMPPLTSFAVPVLPDLDKDTMPVLVALVITTLVLHRRFSFWPQSGVGKLMILAFIFAPVFTVLTNADPLPVHNAPDIPGLRAYDGVLLICYQAIFVMPMFLARRDLATPQAQRDILGALVVGGLIYSVPMLIEARMSPQMNVWIYGFFQHDFLQHVRFGGYRPIVFLPHGLWAAVFVSISLCAAFVLLRTAPTHMVMRRLLAVLWLSFLLFMCKSFGAAIYAIMLVPLIMFVSTRKQVLIAAIVAGVVVAYPLLRGANLIPVDSLISFFNDFSPDRASSLGFRLENEERLLQRAAERPLFGWGSYGRNFTYDPVSGRPTAIADGMWVIQIGIFGWLGYLAQFGLLALPLWLLGRESVQRGVEISRPAAGVAMILAANVFDLLPNATLVPLTWLLAGAVLGHVELLRRERRQQGRDSPALRRGATRPQRTVI